jgi:hypothetical protein
MIPVKDHKFLFRDEKTNAIINYSNSDYENFLIEKEKKIKEIEKSAQLFEDVEILKNDINEIKNLLKQVISKEV